MIAELLKMRVGSLLAFALLSFAGPGTQAMETSGEESLDCRACGTWTVYLASPPGSIGEQITVSKDRVVLPGCGAFKVTRREQQVVDAGGEQRQVSKFELKTVQPDSLCAADPEAVFQLEVVTYVGYRAEAGLGDFELRVAGQKARLLTAQTWNYDREDPCLTGSGRGSVACQQIANAKTIKALAYEAFYIADAGRRNFNASRFAAAAMASCQRRESGSGFGHWPYAWALVCQDGLLRNKLTELRALGMCQLNASPGGCRPLDERFKRSRRSTVLGA